MGVSDEQEFAAGPAVLRHLSSSLRLAFTAPSPPHQEEGIRRFVCVDERAGAHRRELRVALPVAAGTLNPVQGVSFHVDRGETLCIVGECRIAARR